MSKEQNSHSDSEHTLSRIAGFPHELLEPLANRWIQTAEQLLAVALAPNGEEGLAELLDLDQAKLTSILNAVRKSIGPECVSAIESRAKRGGPLGVRFSDEQKRRLGLDNEEPGGPTP